jgi:hypothetical protein
VGVNTLSGGYRQDIEVIMAEMLNNKSISVKVSVKYGNTAFGSSYDQKQYLDFINKLLSLNLII